MLTNTLKTYTVFPNYNKLYYDFCRLKIFCQFDGPPHLKLRIANPCRGRGFFMDNWYKHDQQPRALLFNFVGMIYSKYFSAITKESGQPNLSPEQFRRMMNIVFLEGIIAGITGIKEKEKNEFFKYDTLIFKYASMLDELTGNQSPNELVREMCMLTQEM